MAQKIFEKLRDSRYRKQFSSATVRRTVAAQIRALREREQWTQEELGKRSGMKANAISRLEDPEYGEFTVKTLLRLADAFDLGLVVRFAAFSELATWGRQVNVSSYTPPSFANDRGLRPQSTAVDTNAYLRPSVPVSPIFLGPEVKEQQLQGWEIAEEAFQALPNQSDMIGQQYVV